MSNTIQSDPNWPAPAITSARRTAAARTGNDVAKVAQGLQELVRTAEISGPAAASLNQEIAGYDRSGKRLVQQLGGNVNVIQAEEKQ